MWAEGDTFTIDERTQCEELLTNVRKTHRATVRKVDGGWVVTIGREKTYTMRFLSAEDVIEMNRVIVEESGESFSVMFRANLDYIVFRHGRKIGPSNPFYRGAILLHGLATTHVFVEGDKRTAITACDTFLRDHCYKIQVSADQLVQFTLEVSRDSLPIEEVYLWLLKHTRKIK